jgi:xanthine dehydrogenase molybdopterin-binding subunit B
MPRLVLAGGAAMSQADGPGAYLGRPLARVEDVDLLCGRGRFSDDLPVRTGTLHAAILRSPHAHAELLSVDAEAASAILGVVTVVTGDDAKRCAPSLLRYRRLSSTGAVYRLRQMISGAILGTFAGLHRGATLTEGVGLFEVARYDPQDQRR